MSSYEFKSVFASYMRGFVNAKAAMGYNSNHYLNTFKEFDIISLKEGIETPMITKSLFIKWKDSRVNDSNRTIYGKSSQLVQFTKYMCHIGYPCYIPRMPKLHEAFIPHIFTHEEIKEIFQTSDSMLMILNDMSTKLFAIPAILRLLYSTGLRSGEAVGLKNSDVDLLNDVILIQKTKNQQQRLIPINQSMKCVLIQYIKERDKLSLNNVRNKDSYFFISPIGAKINIGNVYDWFKIILKKCGIPHIGNHCGPRVHDLRHTFAVHSLIKQVKSGADIYCILPILSVFLGHKTIAGTERYVRLTQEMFPDIINMENSVSSFIFPSTLKIFIEDENE